MRPGSTVGKIRLTGFLDNQTPASGEKLGCGGVSLQDLTPAPLMLPLFNGGRDSKSKDLIII
jgi:hypothetical protein